MILYVLLELHLLVHYLNHLMYQRFLSKFQILLIKFGLCLLLLQPHFLAYKIHHYYFLYNRILYYQHHEYFHPMLTTLCQPMEEMGRRSVEILMDMIHGRGRPRCETVRTVLRRGASVRRIN